jgi:hypothetical protein
MAENLITVKIDGSQVIQSATGLERSIPAILQAVAARIRGEIRDIIIGVYYQALGRASGGFPAVYEEHLTEGIARISPEVVADGPFLYIRYFDLEALGTKDDLDEGTHYHALEAIENKSDFSVSNPRMVELPYRGQELFNPQSKRYDFWQKLVSGMDVEIQLGGGKSPKHTKVISTGGLYDQTLEARVDFWRTKGVYPEWLILEYGTPYNPSVPATHFRFLMEQRVIEYAQDAAEQVADEFVAVWDRPGVGINVAGLPYDTSTGRFVKRSR